MIDRYVFVARLDYKDLMDKIDDEETYYVGNMKVKTIGERLLCYKHNGVVCSECGKNGVVILAQRYPIDKSAHINFYSIETDGSLSMMTVDHIIPRSMGGKNHHKNYEPMCQECNLKKGNDCSLKDLLDYNLKLLNSAKNEKDFSGILKKILKIRSVALSNGVKYKLKNIRKEQLFELKKLIKNGYNFPFDVSV